MFRHKPSSVFPYYKEMIARITQPQLVALSGGGKGTSTKRSNAKLKLIK